MMSEDYTMYILNGKFAEIMVYVNGQWEIMRVTIAIRNRQFWVSQEKE